MRHGHDACLVLVVHSLFLGSEAGRFFDLGSSEVHQSLRLVVSSEATRSGCED